jgi:hypothetical protein
MFCLCLSLLGEMAVSALAQEQSLKLLTQSQYFDVYGYEGIDIYTILKKLNTESLRPEYVLTKRENNFTDLLAEMIDTIYLETSDILDIHVYSLKAKIKFVPSTDDVGAIFQRYMRLSMAEPSFYLHDNKTIYISVGDLTLGMLGHEMGHVIISHFFVVPPPMKVQEVLCGYVDFNLQKKIGRRR